MDSFGFPNTTNGRKIAWSATAPAGMINGQRISVGDIWIDTASYSIQVYNGTDWTSGAESLGSIILTDYGRISTSTTAGAALTLDASYTRGNAWYGRWNVSSWTGIGSSIDGLYMRVETNVASSGKELRGIQSYAVSNNVTTGGLKGILAYAYVKGTTAATVGPAYGIHGELSFDAGASTKTITTEAAAGLLKITGGVVDTYTKLHGLIIRAGDMDGQNRTYGNGILVEDDSTMAGSITWTTGINITAACTNDISLQNGETISNTTNGTIQLTSGVLKHAFDAAAYWTATQADGGGATFNSVSDGTAGFTFSNPVTVNHTISTVSLGTVRSIIGNITASGADIDGGTIAGVRGNCTLSGTITAGGAFLYGSQGKLTVTGTMNHADSRLCGSIAQLDISAGTYTAGQLSALWVDAGASAASAHDGGGQFNMIRVTNTTQAVPNSVMYVYAEASYLFDLAGGPGGNADWFAVNTHSIDSHALSYVIKIKDPAGNAGYIPVLASVPS